MKLFAERYVRFSTYKIIPFCRFWKYTVAPTYRGNLHQEGTLFPVLLPLVVVEWSVCRKRAP
jgi:hypothetical protein